MRFLPAGAAFERHAIRVMTFNQLFTNERRRYYRKSARTPMEQPSEFPQTAEAIKELIGEYLTSSGAGQSGGSSDQSLSISRPEASTRTATTAVTIQLMGKTVTIIACISRHRISNRTDRAGSFSPIITDYDTSAPIGRSPVAGRLAKIEAH